MSEILRLRKGTSSDRLAKLSAAVAYCSISTLLTILNKFVLSQGSFGHVNFLICAQQILILLSLCGGHVMRIATLQLVSFWRQPSFWAVFLTFVLYVTSSLHGLRFVSLPLYTVLRKTGVLTTVIAEWVLLTNERPAARTLIAVFTILFGAIIAGYNDLEFDVAGYAWCLFCNIATSLYMISISKHKLTETVDTANLLFQCAICSIPLFFFLSVVTGEFSQAVTYLRVADNNFLIAFITSSLFAGFLNVATMLNTRMNSPTTQSICASFKDVLIVIVAQVIQPSVLSFASICGLVLTFAGTTIHSFQSIGGAAESCWKSSQGIQRTFALLLVFCSLFGSLSVYGPLVGGALDNEGAVLHSGWNSSSVPHNLSTSIITHMDQREGAAKGGGGAGAGGGGGGGREQSQNQHLRSTRVPGGSPFTLLPPVSNSEKNSDTLGKGNAVVTFDNTDILNSPEGDFIFLTFMWNKILEARGNFKYYRHFHGRDCYIRKDIMDREDHQVKMDPHWCRIHIIWKLLDEGYERVMYIDTDILLLPTFTFDAFMQEAETLTDYLPFQNKTSHRLADRSLYGICIKEGGSIFITSGLLLLVNNPISYQILKKWISLYPAAVKNNSEKNDQGPLLQAIKSESKFADSVSLTCSRALWKHYFNGLGPEVRRIAIRSQLAQFMRESVDNFPLESPYSHLLENQQNLAE